MRKSVFPDMTEVYVFLRETSEKFSCKTVLRGRFNDNEVDPLSLSPFRLEFRFPDSKINFAHRSVSLRIRPDPGHLHLKNMRKG